MTQMNIIKFLSINGITGEKNIQRYKNGWTFTEIRIGKQFDFYKKEFFKDPNSYDEYKKKIKKTIK